MEFIDLKAQQARIRDAIDYRIKKVLDHGQYVNGPEVRELENKLAGFVGTKNALAVSSGTNALLMSLMAYGVGPGDAVFTPAFGYISTVEVICQLKATPVFIDIDKNTFNIDTVILEEAILMVFKNGDLKPRGIIAVDTFGQAADYQEINALGKKFNLFVIEDAAHSLGGTYKGRKNCSHADLGTTSFYPAKPFGAYGNGGMIFTDNDELHERLISLRNHGKGEGDNDYVRAGINGYLDTFQAAVLLAKFEIFQEEIELRQSIAEIYDHELKGLVEIPYVKEFNISPWAQYSIKSEQRTKIINYLKEKDIPCRIYYPKPLPSQKVITGMYGNSGAYPVTQKVCNEIFSIPMHSYLNRNDQFRIIECLNKAVHNVDSISSK